MTEFKQYAKGQPIEPIEETRVYVHKDVLKYLELYQEIGTIPQLRALKELSDEYFLKCKEYESIGTVEECRTAVERMKPRKPMHNGANWYRCPNGCEVHKKQFEKDWYCPMCGQRLDWSE